MLIITLTMMNK